MTTESKLDELYRIAEAIEEGMEDILEELKDLVESLAERTCRKDEADYYDEPNGY